MDIEKRNATESESFQLVTFRLGRENYGIPVSEVKEIIRPIKAFPVPGMAEPVLGVINLRGEIIPVLEIHSVLGVEEDEDNAKSRKKRVIILDSSEGRFGFIVDEVKDVVQVESKDIRKSPEVSSDHSFEESVLGIVQGENGMLICIDPEKIVKQCLDIKELFEECLNV
ncbi:MAG: purine-binding chemotaxis protein CheW [Candidatus Krumholzibacteriota bacterium]|nr:purine-binding chemotaxis protein CheW [Candidatus Krumholzibacteriota bacterium]